MSTQRNDNWRYLERNYDEPFRHLHVKGTAFSAWDIYTDFLSEPMSPDELAEDRGVPREAILEAIAYCATNPPELQEDFEAEERFFREHGLDKPHPLSPAAQQSAQSS